MDRLAAEKKYIEERVLVLRSLMEKYGKEILEEASKAKQEVIKKRIREQYKGKLPLKMDEFFKETFEDFEGVGELCSYEILDKNDKHLKVKMNKCWYADIYRSLKARDIGEAMVCRMDYAQNEVFNPKIKFQRPKKLMDDDDCCIFEYHL